MPQSELQTQLHYLFQGDTDVPTTSATDYTLRQGLFNAAIQAWDATDGVLWNELYAVDTSNVANGSSTQYNLNNNFRFLTGYVQTLNASSAYKSWRVLPIQQAHLYNGQGNAEFVYISGTPGAYKVNFGVAPTAADTISIPYYKTATQLTSASSVTECPDPYYLIHYALSFLYQYDNNYAGYNAARQEAESRLSAMRVRNAAMPHYQEHRTPDLTHGFGE